MIREERQNAILSMLKEDAVVSIGQLMDMLGASRSTIRRDLEEMEQQKKLRRTHGGAVSIKSPTSYEPPFGIRKDLFLEEKQRIAQAAVEMIRDNDTILLDSGTTIAALARELRHHKNLYIATNDLISARELSENDDIELTVLGGLLRKHHYSMAGYFTESIIKQIHADSFFMGVDAIDFNIGYMNFSVEESNIKKLMIQAAHRVVVLCDHSKFDKVAFVNICPFENVDAIITGKEIADKHLKKAEDLGINIITV